MMNPDVSDSARMLESDGLCVFIRTCVGTISKSSDPGVLDVMHTISLLMKPSRFM